MCVLSLSDDDPFYLSFFFSPPYTHSSSFSHRSSIHPVISSFTAKEGQFSSPIIYRLTIASNDLTMAVCDRAIDDRSSPITTIGQYNTYNGYVAVVAEHVRIVWKGTFFRFSRGARGGEGRVRDKTVAGSSRVPIEKDDKSFR